MGSNAPHNAVIPDSMGIERLVAFVAGSHGRSVLLLVVVCCALFLPGFTTLPPMDRDEARFAQASKQMLETGDFVVIRFQDELRNKKPPGIHWLQVACVKAGEALGVPDARRKIWVYRLPSLLGALGAVLLTYWSALACVGRRYALLAALMLATTLVVGVEARLAKTDAVLLAASVALLGALLRVFLREGPARFEAVVFWSAWTVGVLVKGPIVPLFALLACLALALAGRELRWLRRLSPAIGFALSSACVAPWVFAIQQRTGGAFLNEAVGHDLLGKVRGAQEAHGAPPLTHAALFLVTAWPVAPLVLLSLGHAWRARSERAVRLLVAWILPSWIVFELVPTKLPHYVLPAFPALVILCAHGLERGALRELGSRARWLMWSLPCVCALLVCAPLVILPSGPRPGAAYVAASGAAIVVALFAARRRQEPGTRVAFSGCTALLSSVALFGVLASSAAFAPLSISTRLADEVRRAAAERAQPVELATAGWFEPSLVFLTRTDLARCDGAGAAQFLLEHPAGLVFVESSAEAAFRGALGARPVRERARVRGVDPNRGLRHPLDIGVFERPAP